VHQGHTAWTNTIAHTGLCTGYYADPKLQKSKAWQQAQYDYIDELLKLAGVDKAEQVGGKSLNHTGHHMVVIISVGALLCRQGRRCKHLAVAGTQQLPPACGRQPCLRKQGMSTLYSLISCYRCTTCYKKRLIQVTISSWMHKGLHWLLWLSE